MVARGDTVLVHEPGIEPWQGSVRTIKPPVAENRKGQTLDQWADVRRLDGIEYKVPLSYLEVLDTLDGLREDTSYWDMKDGNEFEQHLARARKDNREALDKLADR